MYNESKNGEYTFKTGLAISLIQKSFVLDQ